MNGEGSSMWQGITIGDWASFFLSFLALAVFALNPWQYAKREDQLWIVRWALCACAALALIFLLAYLGILPLGLLSFLYFVIYVLVVYIFWGWGDQFNRQRRALLGLALFVTCCVHACAV